MTRGTPEPEDRLPIPGERIVPAPAPKPEWETVRPGIERNRDGQLRTVGEPPPHKWMGAKP